MAKVPTEKEEQKAVIDWADAHIDIAPPLEWLHADLNGIPLPGSATTRARIINSMKAQGMKPGILDLSLDAARRGYHGLKIDMKRVRGGKVLEGQIEYMDYLASEGYLGQICQGANKAIGLLKWYLDIDCDCALCQVAEVVE